MNAARFRARLGEVFWFVAISLLSGTGLCATSPSFAEEGQLCTFSAQTTTSTCPRVLRHGTRTISNYALIAETFEEQTVALTFRGKFSSASALTRALNEQGMFGVGSVTDKNFSLKQNKRAKFFIGDMQCKALMNFHTEQQLEEGPLLPIAATIQFRCPGIRCSTNYSGVLDTEAVLPE